MIDVLIKNGTIIDGTWAIARRGDIAIEKGKITEISASIEAKANQIINAEGRFVAPGFIDIQNHSDSYWTLFDQPDQTSLLSQGVTTIVMGNCGASLAPLLSQESIKTIQKWHDLTGININWTTVGEFLEVVKTLPLGVNVATLIGHATIKRGLIADQVRALTSDEIKVAQKVLKDGLEQGALGLSMGLVYAHEVNSSTTELNELTKVLKPYNKYLSVHLRSETNQVLESIDEAVEIANLTEVPVKISHLKVRGNNNWPLFDRMINKLETAYHQGLNISFDVYPYDSTWGVLYTYLPKWAYEGGRHQILDHLKDPVSRRKITDYLNSQDLVYGKIIVASAYGNKSMVGKSLAQIATNQGVSGADALMNAVVATNAQVVVFDHNISTDHVELLASSPLSMIATDGAGYAQHTRVLMHPRCFGAIPRFLNMVAKKRILKWEQAIRKITSDPAKLMGLSDRGILAKGNIADVVIFDPEKIQDNATHEIPNALSSGIDCVVVNGQVVYQQGKVVNLAGQVIKR